MSTETARKKLNGHGRVVCKKCEKVIISCRCMGWGEDIKYDICDSCEKENSILKIPAKDELSPSNSGYVINTNPELEDFIQI